MLTEVLEREVENAALSQLLENYNEVITIEDEDCGTFTLERYFSWFAGTVDWLGEDCHVTLECDEENGTTADLAQFKKLYANLETWDQNFRNYAAEELTETANDWQDEDCYEEEEDANTPAKITKEDFAKRIVISEFSIYAEGDYEAYYGDDDMFFDHVIIVNGNVDGEIEDAYIAG